MNIEAQTRTLTGLGTTSFHVTVAGAKTVKGKLTLPELDQGSPANSQVVVTVNLNGGSAFYTSSAGDRGFDTGTYANPGDVINIILSSSLPADTAINAVKCTLSCY